MPELRGSAGIGIAAVLLIAAGGIFYYFGGHRGYHAINSSYFVDEETGEESVHPLTDIPPLIGKSGKSTLVREVKYSLDGGKTVKVAYYLKFNDATKKKLEDLVAAGKNINEVDTTPGQLVRSPAPDSKWVSVGSDDGPAITHIDIPKGKEDQFITVVP